MTDGGEDAAFMDDGENVVEDVEREDVDEEAVNESGRLVLCWWERTPPLWDDERLRLTRWRPPLRIDEVVVFLELPEEMGYIIPTTKY